MIDQLRVLVILILASCFYYIDIILETLFWIIIVLIIGIISLVLFIGDISGI